jgi:hypothetical protein
MFKETTEYKEIKREVCLNGTYNNKLKFSCFSDGMLIFTQKVSEGITQEITIKTDCDILSDNTLAEIMDLPSITFFQHSIFGQHDLLIASKFWTAFSEVVFTDIS